ncbi:TPA: hypothetical protein N2D16_002840 [Clostridium botulinum]|nr:hypothetical protein [Clostridium botulinum]HCL4455216.1 hypothetical protein [Clostridium botulinum]
MTKKYQWTIEEDDYIEKYYLVKSDKEIGKILGLSETRIKLRRYKLGFKKQRQTFHKESPEGMKWCWFCNEHHPIEYFSKNKNKPDGLQDECKIAVKQMVLNRKAKQFKKKKNNVLKEKQCEKCDQIKTIENFIKNVSTKDGYSNLCRECLNENLNRKFKIKEGR